MALAVRRWALRSLFPRTTSRVLSSTSTAATSSASASSASQQQQPHAQQRQWVEAGSGDVKRNAEAPASDNEQAEGQTAAQKLSAALRRVTYNDVAEVCVRLCARVSSLVTQHTIFFSVSAQTFQAL